MATAVHIGGVGAGLETSMKTGAPVRQGQAAGAAERPSFAAQFQASLAVKAGKTAARASGTHQTENKPGNKPVNQPGNQTVNQTGDQPVNQTGNQPGNRVDRMNSIESALAEPMPPKPAVAAHLLRAQPLSRPEPPAAPSAGQTNRPSVAVSSKSEPVGKPHSGDRNDTARAGDAKDGVPALQTLAVLPILPVKPMQTAIPAQGAKAGNLTGNQVHAGGKLPIGRGSGAKPAPRLEGAAGVAAPADATPSGDGVSAFAAVQGAALAGAATQAAVGGVGGLVSGAVGVAIAVPDGTASATAATGRLNAHRAAPDRNGDLDAAHGAAAGGGVAFGETRTLVTTPNVLEVGITGGAHGWLRVRAELGHTGEVTASLVASSAASADALHKELGAMSAYLKSEVVGVSSLAVTAMEKGGAAPGFSSQTSAGGSGAGAQGGGGKSPRPGAENDANPSLPGAAGAGSSGSGASYEGAVPAALLASGVGGWLNVRV